MVGINEMFCASDSAHRRLTAQVILSSGRVVGVVVMGAGSDSAITLGFMESENVLLHLG
jgi:hypothetical protein